MEKHKIVYKSGNCLAEKARCVICDFSFGSRAIFEDHMRNLHITEDKRYRCPLCSKTFSIPGTVKKHVKAVHQQLSQAQSSKLDQDIQDIQDMTDMPEGYESDCEVEPIYIKEEML